MILFLTHHYFTTFPCSPFPFLLKCQCQLFDKKLFSCCLCLMTKLLKKKKISDTALIEILPHWNLNMIFVMWHSIMFLMLLLTEWDHKSVLRYYWQKLIYLLTFWFLTLVIRTDITTGYNFHGKMFSLWFIASCKFLF